VWVIAATMLLAAIAGDITQTEPIDSKAEEVIARTRTIASTYTIYWRVRIAGNSLEPEYAWGATFRRGALLRVEDLRSRAVADCSSGTGTQYYHSVGRNDYSVGRKIAERYCGIDADRKIRSTRWLGQKDSKFGLVDELRVVDEDGTFTYQVTAAGEVVGVTSVFRGSTVAVVAEPMSFEHNVPAGDLFTRTSLATSKVSRAIQSQGSRAGR